MTPVEANVPTDIEANEQPSFDLATHIARLGDLAIAAETSRQRAEWLQQQLAHQRHGSETAAAQYNRAFERGIQQLISPENSLTSDQQLQGLFDMLRTGKHPDWLDTFRQAQAYGTRLKHDEPIWINGRLHTVCLEEAQQAPVIQIGHNPHDHRRHSGNQAPFVLRHLIWTQQSSAEPVRQLVSHSENPVGRSDIKTMLDTQYEGLRWAPRGCFDARKADKLESLAEGYQALGLPDRAAACRELLSAVNYPRRRPAETPMY